MLVFASATQGFWMVKNRWYETIAMLLSAFSMFRPGYWWDMVYEPTIYEPATKLVEYAEKADPDSELKLEVSGLNIEGDEVSKTVLLPLGEAADGETRLSNAGLMLRNEDDKVIIDMVAFGSPAQDLGLDFDWEIEQILVAAERPPKQLVFIPALALLVLLGLGQRRRKPQESEANMNQQQA
jgi:hypothetical protein